MWRMKRFLLLLSLAFGMILPGGYSQAPDGANPVEADVHSPSSHATTVDTEQDELLENSREHETDMSPLFFVIIALFIGAATRHFLRKSRV